MQSLRGLEGREGGTLCSESSEQCARWEGEMMCIKKMENRSEKVGELRVW